MDYLKIFLPRIVMSEKAARFLGCEFRLYINNVIINTVKRMSAKQIAQVPKTDEDDLI